ncbi:hypothetical protein HJC23_009626, partial [Cyclotella cryptica]
HKVQSKILDCAWSFDGVHLALAHESGDVSLFNSTENKVIASIYKCDAPVCCVEWSSKHEVVFGSKKCLSFYDIVEMVFKSEDIGFTPFSIQHSGGFLVISGFGGCTIKSTNATDITKIAGENIWSSCCSPNGDMLVVGTEAGAVVVNNIDYSKNPNFAIELFIQLNRWDQARELAEKTGCLDIRTLGKRQAEWALQIKDINLAKSAYLESHDYVSVIELLRTNREKYGNWETEILEIVRISGSQKEVLAAAIEVFVQGGDYHHLAQLYIFTKDYNKLLQLHIEHRNWKEADKILDEQKDLLDGGGSLARAKILVMQGQFLQAFDFYLDAGRLDMARKIMIELSTSAAERNEYNNASHYLWILAKALRERAVVLTDDVSDLIKRSECYYLYNRVFLSCTEPFVAFHPEALLNAAALLYNNCVHYGRYGCVGISITNVLSTLAKQASTLDANYTVKLCFDKLKEHQIPPPFPQVLSDSNKKSLIDNSDVLPVCYRCGSENGLIQKNSTDNQCIDCGHPFLRCFLNFDVLPLVEFEPETGILDDEAMDLIVNQECLKQSNVMFDDCIVQSLDDVHQTAGEVIFKPIVVDRNVLASLDRVDVFVISAKTKANIAEDEKTVGKRCRFFKNLLPEIGIALCPQCDHFFHEEDFEFAVLRDSGCPFCQCNIIGQNYGHA